MSGQSHKHGPAAGLLQCLDEIAAQVILGTGAGEGCDVAGALAKLATQAGQAGYGEAAEIAASLHARSEQQSDAGTRERVLVEGLARLQAVLRGEPSPAAAQPQTPPAAPINPIAQDPELIGDFVMESREHLASIETQLLTLEQNPTDSEAMHAAFRGFHTIKGLAGFLELNTIREVAHQVETVLDQARNGELAITPAVIDVVLQSGDFLKASVAIVEEALGSGSPAVFGDPTALLASVLGLTTVQSPSAQPAATAPKPPGPVAAASPPADTTPAVEPPAARAAKQTTATDNLKVRVDAAKLDYLMDMVGEMVIAQSMIRHHPALTAQQDSRLNGCIAQLSRITGEVQRTAMALRMIPIGQLFQRTARVVRDLARKHGKLVDLETSGEDTELDKSIAEELSDPLMHMVRNAVDHGIEHPADREKAGKEPTSRLRLAAYHQAGMIVVEVADDGRGLDRAKILKKARERGLVDANAHLSESEVCSLIFEPGFSTAEKVTDVSGRGVGMDVVRKQIQKLRGRVDIVTRPGHGTTFYMRMPLTLAIIDGLAVSVGSQNYIVPIFSVREMFRPQAGQISTVQGRDEMALVRDRLLPVVRLHKRFAVEPRYANPYDALLIVAEAEGRPFCLMVDELIGKQEVVIKSLGETFRGVPGIAGGAILGDGKVGLILDIAGLRGGSAG
ncbi:MAG: chemotaxis protein CheA [Acidobacteria bacterium]|nr:chemotaxis protein CheA [Acidobacteriota bacterium]